MVEWSNGCLVGWLFVWLLHKWTFCFGHFKSISLMPHASQTTAREMQLVANAPAVLTRLLSPETLSSYRRQADGGCGSQGMPLCGPYPLLTSCIDGQCEVRRTVFT